MLYFCSISNNTARHNNKNQLIWASSRYNPFCPPESFNAAMLRCTTYIKQANQEVEGDLDQERHISLSPDAGGNFKLKTSIFEEEVGFYSNKVQNQKCLRTEVILMLCYFRMTRRSGLLNNQIQNLYTELNSFIRPPPSVSCVPQLP